VPSSSPAGRAIWLATVLVLVLAGCQKDELLKPGTVPSNVITAFYVHPDSLNSRTEIRQMELDGQAKDTEWGGLSETDRAYTMIRLTAEDGSGNPGGPVYVAAKAVYTDRDLFLLFQWNDLPGPDEGADAMKDAFVYVGPEISADADSAPAVLQQSSWLRSGFEEDRLYVAFEMTPAGDGMGTFRQQGCQIACHTGQSPQFGRPGYGRLDVWQWLSTRTNVSRRLYVENDNPELPEFGTPAWLDDYVADPASGLTPDPGTATWRRNWIDGINRPLYIYRSQNDPFHPNNADPTCRNDFNERCITNNRIPTYYIWRENIDLPVPMLDSLDVFNQAVLPQGQENARWAPPESLATIRAMPHYVTGYFYTYPSGSRANVRGKAEYSDDGRWTLEIGRPLNTGDTFNDKIFQWTEDENGERYIPDVYFAIGMADASRAVHWGSGPQVLRFAKPTTTAGRAPGNGGSR